MMEKEDTPISPGKRLGGDLSEAKADVSEPKSAGVSEAKANVSEPKSAGVSEAKADVSEPKSVGASAAKPSMLRPSGFHLRALPMARRHGVPILVAVLVTIVGACATAWGVVYWMRPEVFAPPNERGSLVAAAKQEEPARASATAQSVHAPAPEQALTTSVVVPMPSAVQSARARDSTTPAEPRESGRRKASGSTGSRPSLPSASASAKGESSAPRDWLE